MSSLALKLAALLVVLGLGGVLGAASGLIPITASSGHWAITRWFLQFAKTRSVATHTIGADDHAPAEPWLVMKGAGHYHTGCLPCHGSPAAGYFPAVVQGMAPRPPYLPKRIHAWAPDELFYIVKHGIKFTGMPGWLAQERDDEVRAVVAFLLQLPNLGPDDYRRLVNDVPPSRELPQVDGVAPEVLAGCARCHGVDGLGRGVGAFPKLAGQRREYLAAALDAFAHSQRHSGIMQPVAASLSPRQAQALAEYFSRLPAGGETTPPGDRPAIARGRDIALHGIPGQRVPACADCHGPGATRRRPAYPRLAGQYPEYLMLQLDLFKTDRRGGSAYAHLMAEVAPYLTAEQIRDVALYYASLPADADRAPVLGAADGDHPAP